jgi:hypothetical protein
MSSLKRRRFESVESLPPSFIVLVLVVVLVLEEPAERG